MGVTPPPSIRQFPLRAFTVAIALTLVLLLLTSWLTWHSYIEYEDTLVRSVRLQELADIIESEPAPASLARMLVIAGHLPQDDQWQRRHENIRGAIEEIRALSNGEDAIEGHAMRIGQILSGLEEFESRALDLAARGDRAAAEQLLFGGEYHEQLRTLMAMNELLRSALSDRVHHDIESLKRKSLAAFGVTTAVVPILLLMWMTLLRMARFHLRERSRLEEELRAMSLNDELTGVFNRRGFLTIAEQQCRQANRTGRSMLMVFCDLDDMKSINDEHGHSTGDEALRRTARLLVETFRESDVIGRIGGDEFVVLVTDFIDSDVRSVHRRIYRTLRQYNAEGDFPVKLALSLGHAWYDPRNPKSVVDLMAEADATMYKQKKSRPGARMLDSSEVGL